MVNVAAPTTNIFSQLALSQASLFQAAAQLPPFVLPSLLDAYSAQMGQFALLNNPQIPPRLAMSAPQSVRALTQAMAADGYAGPATIDLAGKRPNNFLSRLLDPERREAAKFEQVLRNDPVARQAFEAAIGGRIVDFGSTNDGKFKIERFPETKPLPFSGPMNPLVSQLQGVQQQMQNAALASLALGGVGGAALGALGGSAFGSPFLGMALGGLGGVAAQLVGRGGFDSFSGGVQGFPLFGMASASWNPLAQPGKINGSNAARELVGTAQVSSVLSDPSLTMEDKIMLAMMLICSKMDDDIKRQTEYLNQLQNQQGNRNKTGGLGGLLGGGIGALVGGPMGAKVGSGLGGAIGSGGQQDGEKSIDIESKKLERMITKRSQLFDTMGKIMERYDQSAKNVIQSMRG